MNNSFVTTEAAAGRCCSDKHFAKFTEKHMCQSLFSNKVVNLLKMRLWHKYFPVNFTINAQE